MKIGELKEILSQYNNNVNIDIIIEDSYRTMTAGAKIKLYRGPGVREEEKLLGIKHRDIKGDVSSVNMTIVLNNSSNFGGDKKHEKITYRK